MNYDIETSKSYLKLLDNNVIYLKYKLNVNFELNDAIEVNNHIYNLAQGKPYSVLVDGRGNNGNITNDARNHYATDPKTREIRQAEALILDNIATRIFAKLYIKINKPNNQIKIFSKYDEAEEWVINIMNDYVSNSALETDKSN